MAARKPGPLYISLWDWLFWVMDTAGVPKISFGSSEKYHIQPVALLINQYITKLKVSCVWYARLLLFL